ncbi:MAG: prepilin-type N-terminal cleavage/methylation domain-containing protein [Elusimicrobia bacterium]|nr:prepilin-type N-terminal cleavage/methylation domain-containing protein [Elusimicrobiota bacterium]
MKKKIKGFTLMEVIITMIIVITLSLISWPIYRGRHREYTMLAEGYALLGAIKEAQINYYNEYGNFLCATNSFGSSSGYACNDYTAADPVLGINVMNNRYFSWFNYDTYYSWVGKWKYEICIRVLSKDVGTITQLFNLTERSEPTVLGGKNVTFY